MVTPTRSGQTVLEVCASMVAVVTVAVALRMLAKLKIKTGLVLDDYAIIVAMVLFYAYTALLLQGVLGPGSGGSAELRELSLRQVEHFLKYLYIEQLVFAFTITSVKISLLSFYQRIFSVRVFRRWVLFVGALCLVWLVVCLFLIIFQCSPVPAAWRVMMRLSGARCIPATRIVFGAELANVLLDILILALPIYMVRRLQLPRRRKVVVGGIFLLGGFVCVTCVIRMYFMYDPKARMDTPRSLPRATNWSTIELAAAIVCACLPAYGPLLTSVPCLKSSVQRWYHSLRGSLRRSRPSSHNKASVPDSDSDQQHTTTTSDDSRRPPYPRYPSPLLEKTCCDPSHLTLAFSDGPIWDIYPSGTGAQWPLPNRINVENTVEIV